MRASTLILLAAFTTSCGVLPETKETTKSIRSEEGIKGPRPHGDTTKGSMAFALPPEEEGDTVARFEVTIRGWDDCSSDRDNVTYLTQTEKPVKEDIEEGGDGSDSGDSDDEEEVHEEPAYEGCGGLVYEGIQSIFLADTRDLNIGDLPAGYYDVEVRLYDENDQLLEEGYANTYVFAGQSSNVAVQLHAVDGHGALTVTVLRAGEEPIPTEPSYPVDWKCDTAE